MARTRQRWRSNRMRIDMTSLIDVVFLLLVFFMLNMRFVAAEGTLLTHLPKDQGGDPGPVGPERDAIRIHLDWVVGGAGGPQTSPDYGALAATLETMYALSTLDGVTRAERLVFIDARPQVPYKHVVRAIDTCVGLGLTNIRLVHTGAFATQRAGESEDGAMWWEEGRVRCSVGEAIAPLRVPDTHYAIDRVGASGTAH